MSGAFKVMRGGGKPRKVRLLFTGRLARYAGERRWHPTQKVSWRGNDCILEMTVTALDELAAWVMSFGGECAVLAPRELRDLVVEGHRRGARAQGRL